MCKDVSETSEVSGYDQLNILFGKEVRCAGCTGDDQCSCNEQ